MGTTDDEDVDRAVATLGGPSIAYRSFPGSVIVGRKTAAEPETASAFPLLAAALPEARDIAVSPPADADIVKPEPIEPTALSLPPTTDIPATPPPRAARPAPEPAHDSTWMRPPDRPPSPPQRQAGRTSLATMFSMLKGTTARTDESQTRKVVLQDLFRRL